MNYKLIVLVVLCLTAIALFIVIDNRSLDGTATISDVVESEKDISLSTQQKDKSFARNKGNLIKNSISNYDYSSQVSDVTKVKSLFDSSVSGGKINFDYEKSLIEYLKHTDDFELYNYIRGRLLNVAIANRDGDRLMEYGISLLAAVGTPAAAEVLLEVVNSKNWENSEAIYLVKKSLEYLNKDGSLNSQLQAAFTDSGENSPFLRELALSLVKHPENEQINYLFSNINEEVNAKTYAATNALKSLTQEPMVPTVSNYLNSSSKTQVDVALNSLANIGQYEAASALIAWSAKQPIEQKDNVARLFEISTNRSPSTRRAIQKEMGDLTFVSQDVKAVVLSYLDVQSIKEE